MPYAVVALVMGVGNVKVNETTRNLKAKVEANTLLSHDLGVSSCTGMGAAELPNIMMF